MSGQRLHRHWIAFAVLLPAAAGAHHSRTQYDGSEVQEIQGELIAVSWANPHAAFSVRVTRASGETATWHLESWGSPYVLSRMGVTPLALGVADPARLGADAADWGRYYDHHPMVLAGHLPQALRRLLRRHAAAGRPGQGGGCR